MASLLQPRLENPKPLSHTAEPYNPTLTTKPNSLLHLHLHPLYQQPPPPPPTAMVMGFPVERGVWCYLNGHLYQHVYHHHHHHHYYQFPPLMPKLEYAEFEVYNPQFFLHSQSQPTKPSGFAMKSSVVLEEVIDGGDVRVPTGKKLVKKIGGSGGAVGAMMKKVERKKYCEKRAASVGVWLPKNIDGHKPTSGEVNGHRVFSQGETTLMMRNIPNKLRRDQLLEILDQHCREENDKGENRPDHVRSAYDFVYLPIDFKRLGNKGYAFINFTTREAAARLRKAMNWCKWDAYLESKKECGFSVARIQGRRALVNHFESSKFPTSTDSFLPVVLLPARDGSYPRSTPQVVGNCV